MRPLLKMLAETGLELQAQQLLEVRQKESLRIKEESVMQVVRGSVRHVIEHISANAAVPLGHYVRGAEEQAGFTAFLGEKVVDAIGPQMCLWMDQPNALSPTQSIEYMMTQTHRATLALLQQWLEGPDDHSAEVLDAVRNELAPENLRSSLTEEYCTDIRQKGRALFRIKGADQMKKLHTASFVQLTEDDIPLFAQHYNARVLTDKTLRKAKKPVDPAGLTRDLEKGFFLARFEEGSVLDGVRGQSEEEYMREGMSELTGEYGAYALKDEKGNPLAFIAGRIPGNPASHHHKTVITNRVSKGVTGKMQYEDADRDTFFITHAGQTAAMDLLIANQKGAAVAIMNQWATLLPSHVRFIELYIAHSLHTPDIRDLVIPENPGKNQASNARLSSLGFNTYALDNNPKGPVLLRTIDGDTVPVSAWWWHKYAATHIFRHNARLYAEHDLKTHGIYPATATELQPFVLE